MTEKLQQFIAEHADDDVLQLLIHASRYSGIDMWLAAEQIAARRRMKDKSSTWHACGQLFYPSTTAVEQCSSETTALYKQRLIQADDRLCDMTGGLGVDAFFLSQKARHVIYIETDEAYCKAARRNLSLLGGANIDVINGNAAEMLRQNDPRLADVSVFYIDPARRNANGRRLYALSDCEPDLIALWPSLCRHSACIVAKLSPMLDVSMVLSQLPNIQQIHIVSIRNECKELLAIAGGRFLRHVSDSVDEATEIYCVNYAASGAEQSFAFYLSEEPTAAIRFAAQTGRYLYEPNASILKAGAYKTTALRYGVDKLHPSSHLYTSNEYISSFPGRIFEITSVIPFGSRVCKKLATLVPRAHITVRNFPLAAEELRRRANIADGGDVYLFATTLSDGKKTLLQCRKTSGANEPEQ